MAWSATASAAVDLKFNFQPAASAVPAGYTAEGGLPFTPARGYGFVREDSLSGTHVGLDVTSRSRERGANSDQRLDTLIQLAGSGVPAAAWEVSVPDGDYAVTVAAGDPSYFDSIHRVRVEGTTAINYTATSGTRSQTSTVTVHVADGALTLDSIGGTNTKLQYVTIASVPTSGRGVSAKINFAPPSTPLVAGNEVDSGAAYNATRGYGWVRQDSLKGTHTPVSLIGNPRDFNTVADQRIDSYIHMQLPATSSPGSKIPGAWEYAVPNGSYDVTLAVGDARDFTSKHTIHVEGVTAVSAFKPTSTSRFRFASTTVTVSDGRLTIDAIGGSNTKLDYVTIDPAPGGTRPSVGTIAPANGELGVARDRAVTAEVHLPTVGAGVDDATIDPTTVRLVRVADNVQVDAVSNTSGGGDVVVLQPRAILGANTEYRFEITSGLKDLSGAAFKPASSTFTTNSAVPGGSTVARFTKSVQTASQGELSASVQMGPDNRLYATTLDGKILRFPVAADGTLGTPTAITTVINHEGVARHIIGLAFDPASTASSPILWVSHSDGAFANAPDWTGKISRLSGANLGTIQDYITGLPRSTRDHETNSLAFGPDGALYVTQGSNSAMGQPDNQWGLRPEHLLNAAVLRINVAGIASPPLNVKTDSGGTYNPFASGAPVTVYASGVRNAYDLVWASNGQLYVPTNGSAAGGNTPGTPSTLPAVCGRRIDFATRGAWTGPKVGALNNVGEQPDLLFRIQQGGYYGHPNPTRCEWTFFGGNPTSGVDLLQTTAFPVGTQPDRNFRKPSWNVGLHFSPDGAIEYKSNTFGGALKGKLLVTRYSAGDDIAAFSINPTTKEISAETTGITGLGGFTDPLDLTEDTRNGNLYVTELGAAQITLLKPAP